MEQRNLRYGRPLEPGQVGKSDVMPLRRQRIPDIFATIHVGGIVAEQCRVAVTCNENN